MNKCNLTKENHQARSDFVRELVQGPGIPVIKSSVFFRKIPKRIVQFWDNLDRLPADVGECIESWRKTEEQGVERLLFDKRHAGDFILRKLGQRYKRAYDKCYHPAMQSDYFRLCYMFLEGGCYIDVDDVFTGCQIQHLFIDGRLKIQPLCYNTESNMMIPPPVFTKPGINAPSWIFYFNNNPLIACSGHPVIEYALGQATISLEKVVRDSLPEIQSTTGPGNLTKSIFNAAIENSNIVQTLLVLTNWEDFARSRWELSYRNDTRNWRLSNCCGYRES